MSIKTHATVVAYVSAVAVGPCLAIRQYPAQPVRNRRMTNNTITLNQLESHLWEAANILRGPVDAADFKTYVFPLLFFKRISDVMTRSTRRRWRNPAATRSTLASRRTTASRFPRAATGAMCER